MFLPADISVLPFDEEDARVAGDLPAWLENAGTPVGPYDLLIATQALRTLDKATPPEKWLQIPPAVWLERSSSTDHIYLLYRTVNMEI